MFKNFLLITACALLAANLIARTTSDTKAADKNVPEHLTVRGLTVVDDDGNTAVSIGAHNGVRGVWVNGFKKNSTAGIVANEGFDSPYLMVLDWNKPAQGCQFAIHAEKGEPVVQLVGNKDTKIFNPLTDVSVEGKLKIGR